MKEPFDQYEIECASNNNLHEAILTISYKRCNFLPIQERPLFIVKYFDKYFRSIINGL